MRSSLPGLVTGGQPTLITTVAQIAELKFGKDRKRKFREYFVMLEAEAVKYWDNPPDIERPPRGIIPLSKVYRFGREGELIFLITQQSEFFIALPKGFDLSKIELTIGRIAMTNSKKMKKNTIGQKYYNTNPEIFSRYVEQFCPGMDTVTMTDLITQGARIALNIYERSEKTWVDYGSTIETSEEEICAFVWLLVAKAAIYGETFVSGVFRIDDEDGKIFKFLASCRKVYKRISSHFPERLDEIYAIHGPQRGCDLSKNICLPAGKHSILFFRLGDGTTVIKLETAGCPPFWSDGFRSFRNAMEFGKHTKQYVECTMTERSQEYRRDEHYSHDSLSLFAKALDVLYPMTQLRVMSEHDIIENGKGIHHAIQENSFDRLSQFLQYTGSEYYVNFVNDNDETPLIACIKKGRVDMVFEILCYPEVDINYVIEKQKSNTALHLASILGMSEPNPNCSQIYLDIAIMLILCGAATSTFNSDMETPKSIVDKAGLMKNPFFAKEMLGVFQLYDTTGLGGLIAKFEVASTLVESRGKYEKFQKSRASRTETIKDKLFKLGQKCGISMMVRILEAHNPNHSAQADDMSEMSEMDEGGPSSARPLPARPTRPAIKRPSSQAPMTNDGRPGLSSNILSLTYSNITPRNGGPVSPRSHYGARGRENSYQQRAHANARSGQQSRANMQGKSRPLTASNQSGSYYDGRRSKNALPGAVKGQMVSKTLLRSDHNAPKRPQRKAPNAPNPTDEHEDDGVEQVNAESLKLGQIIALPMAVTRPDRSVSNLAAVEHPSAAHHHTTAPNSGLTTSDGNDGSPRDANQPRRPSAPVPLQLSQQQINTTQSSSTTSNASLPNGPSSSNLTNSTTSPSAPTRPTVGPDRPDVPKRPSMAPLAASHMKDQPSSGNLNASQTQLHTPTSPPQRPNAQPMPGDLPSVGGPPQRPNAQPLPGDLPRRPSQQIPTTVSSTTTSTTPTNQTSSPAELPPRRPSQQILGGVPNSVSSNNLAQSSTQGGDLPKRPISQSPSSANLTAPHEPPKRPTSSPQQPDIPRRPSQQIPTTKDITPSTATTQPAPLTTSTADLPRRPSQQIPPSTGSNSSTPSNSNNSSASNTPRGSVSTQGNPMATSDGGAQSTSGNRGVPTSKPALDDLPIFQKYQFDQQQQNANQQGQGMQSTNVRASMPLNYAYNPHHNTSNPALTNPTMTNPNQPMNSPQQGNPNSHPTSPQTSGAGQSTGPYSSPLENKANTRSSLPYHYRPPQPRGPPTGQSPLTTSTPNVSVNVNSPRSAVLTSSNPNAPTLHTPPQPYHPHNPHHQPHYQPHQHGPYAMTNPNPALHHQQHQHQHQPQSNPYATSPPTAGQQQSRLSPRANNDAGHYQIEAQLGPQQQGPSMMDSYNPDLYQQQPQDPSANLPPMSGNNTIGSSGMPSTGNPFRRPAVAKKPMFVVLAELQQQADQQAMELEEIERERQRMAREEEEARARQQHDTFARAQVSNNNDSGEAEGASGEPARGLAGSRSNLLMGSKRVPIKIFFDTNDDQVDSPNLADVTGNQVNTNTSSHTAPDANGEPAEAIRLVPIESDLAAAEAERMRLLAQGSSESDFDETEQGSGDNPESDPIEGVDGANQKQGDEETSQDEDSHEEAQEPEDEPTSETEIDPNGGLRGARRTGGKRVYVFQEPSDEVKRSSSSSGRRHKKSSKSSRRSKEVSTTQASSTVPHQPVRMIAESQQDMSELAYSFNANFNIELEMVNNILVAKKQPKKKRVRQRAVSCPELCHRPPKEPVVLLSKSDDDGENMMQYSFNAHNIQLLKESAKKKKGPKRRFRSKSLPLGALNRFYTDELTNIINTEWVHLIKHAPPRPRSRVPSLCFAKLKEVKTAEEMYNDQKQSGAKSFREETKRALYQAYIDQHGDVAEPQSLYQFIISLFVKKKGSNDVSEITQEEGFVPVLVQQFQCFKSILTDFSTPQQYDKIKDMHAELKFKIVMEREKGYKGEVRGQEVCLPNPLKWLELKEMRDLSASQYGERY